MGKVFKAIVISALIFTGLALILPLIGLSTPFVGLFNLGPLAAAAVGGGIVGGVNALLAPSIDFATTLGRARVSINPNEPMKWIFGETATATDTVWAGAHGSGGGSYYSFIIAAAGHEIDSYGDLYINDELVPISGGAATGAWAGALWVQTNLGTEVQTAFGDIDGADLFGGTKWPVTADGLGIAHFRIRFLRSHDKVSSGIPTRITWKVKGGPVYDPRLDGTRGGTGAHRSNDQTTWEYTNGGNDIGANWALIVLRYLLGWQINSRLVIGMGKSADDIDIDQAMAAANVCDATIDAKERYRIGGIMDIHNNHERAIRELEGAINGKVGFIGGKYFIWAPNDDLTPFSTIDEADLLRDAGVVFAPSGPMESLYNTARGRFVGTSGNELYMPKPYPEIVESTAVTEDGATRVLSHDLPYVQDVSVAERVARSMVRRSRFGGTWRFALGPKGLTFQPFSVTTLNIAETDDTNVTVRIIDMSYSVSGAVVMEVIEEDSSIYNTSAPLGTPITSNPNTGSDPNIVAAVTNLQSVDATIRGDGGTGTDAFSVTWDDPGSNVAATDVQYKVASESIYNQVAPARVDFLGAMVSPVEPGTLYDIRARHINSFGTIGAWASLQDTSGDNQTGQATTVGFTTNIQYDDLDTTGQAAGASRYALLADDADMTSGDIDNFQLAQAVLLNREDLNGIIRTPFFQDVRPGDTMVFYIGPKRWFHYSITSVHATIGSGSTTASLFDLTLIEYVDADPDADHPTAAGTTVEFQFTRPLDNVQNLLIDPDFDLSTGLGSVNGFWVGQVKDSGGGGTPSSISWAAGAGANGSNAVNMQRGNHVIGFVELMTVRKIRLNTSTLEFRIRLRRTGNTYGPPTEDFTAFAEGFDTIEATSEVVSASDTIDIATTTQNVWYTIRLVLNLPNNDAAQFWRMGVALTSATAGICDTIQIDSIFVYGVPDSFGTMVTDDDVVVPGLVPQADVVTDLDKFLKSDGTWATAGAAGTLPTPTVLDSSLRSDGASAWFEETQVRISAAGALTILDAGLTDSMAMSHDGVDLALTFTTTAHLDLIGLTTGMRIRDGGILYIYDSTDVNFGRFLHDGVDFNTVFDAGTTDWNIGGADVRITGEIDAIAASTDHAKITALHTTAGGMAMETENAAGIMRLYQTNSAGALEDILFEANRNTTTALFWNGTQKFFTDQYGFGSNDSIFLVGQSAAGYTPGAGTGSLWMDLADDLFWRNDLGVDVQLNTVGGGQTPWASDIDGGGFGLDNIDRLEIQEPGGPTDTATFTHDGTNFYITFANTLSMDLIGLNPSGGLKIRDGAPLKIYDSTDANNARFIHDGTDFNTLFDAGTTDWNIDGATAIRIGSLDAGNTLVIANLGDSMTFAHDGVDFNMTGVLTASLNITGISLLSVVNYDFDVNQTVGAGQDNYVLTYDNGDGQISLEPAGSGTDVDPVDESADTTTFPLFVNAATGVQGAKTGTNLTFNANTGDLVATSIGGVAMADLLASGSVVVADLANGTDGELITWSAAGVPTVVAVGTADHILTSNGAGAAPVFKVPGAAAGIAEVIVKTASENRTSTTYSDDNHLTGFVLDADSWYAVVCFLQVTPPSGTPDIKLKWVTSQNLQSSWGHAIGSQTTGIVVADSAGMQSDLVLNMTGAGTYAYTWTGYMHTHATLDGTAKLQWAQNSASGTTTLGLGTWASFTKQL